MSSEFGVQSSELWFFPRENQGDRLLIALNYPEFGLYQFIKDMDGLDIPKYLYQPPIQPTPNPSQEGRKYRLGHCMLQGLSFIALAHL